MFFRPTEPAALGGEETCLDAQSSSRSYAVCKCSWQDGSSRWPTLAASSGPGLRVPQAAPPPAPSPDRLLLTPAASRLPGGGSGGCSALPTWEPFPRCSPPRGRLCALDLGPHLGIPNVPPDRHIGSNRPRSGVLASPVASNPKLPGSPARHGHLPTSPFPIGWLCPTSQSQPRLLFLGAVKGELESAPRLPRATRDAACGGPLCVPLCTRPGLGLSAGGGGGRLTLP